MSKKDDSQTIPVKLTKPYLGNSSNFVRDNAGCLAESSVQAHRIGSRGDGAVSSVDERLRHDGGGCGSISGLGITLGSYFDNQGCTDVFFWVPELDLPSNGDAVVDDFRGPIISLQDNVATLGPQGNTNSICHLVDTVDQRPSRVILEGHFLSSSRTERHKGRSRRL